MNLNHKLKPLISKEKSTWLQDAEWRRENRGWLKMSQAISLNILSHLRANNITQKELAEMIGVTPQQVQKIVRGKENLTLETISKIETALKIRLITV